MSTGWALLVGVLALIASVGGGWPLTAGVLRLAARTDRQDADRQARRDAEGSVPTAGDTPTAVDDAGAPDGAVARGILRGGGWIGALERLAVTGAIIVGYPAAIAVVVAVKGLGRFPELREHPGASERFVIGTLASMIWAGALGTLARVLVLGWW